MNLATRSGIAKSSVRTQSVPPHKERNDSICTHPSKFQSIKHPVILRVSIPVLDRPKSMCDSLDGVDDWTAEIVDGVHFPLFASPMMRQRVATVDDGIAHSLVGIVHTDFGSNAPSDAFLCALFHLLEMGKIISYGSVSSLTRQSMPSLMLHFLLLSVIRICLTFFEHGDAVLIELVEVVTCVCCLVRTYPH